MKKLFAFALTVLTALSILACTKTDETASIIGKWEDVTQAKQEGGLYNVYTFEKDGSYKLQGFWVTTNEAHKELKGSYTISGKELKLTPESGVETTHTVTSLTATEMVWLTDNIEKRFKRLTD